MMCIVSNVCGKSQQDCEAYKSATVALAVIAVLSIAINVLLTIFLLRKTPTKGWLIYLFTT